MIKAKREKKRQRTPRQTKSALTSAQTEKYARQKWLFNTRKTEQYRTRRHSESAYIHQVHDNVIMCTATRLHTRLPSNVLVQ